MCCFLTVVMISLPCAADLMKEIGLIEENVAMQPSLIYLCWLITFFDSAAVMMV